MIKFNAGLQIEIQPNSLVVIEDVSSQEGSLDVTFLRGEIKVINESGKSIKLKGDTLKKKSVSLRSKKVEGKTKIEVAEKDVVTGKIVQREDFDAIKELGGVEEEEEIVTEAPIKIDLRAIEKSIALKEPVKTEAPKNLFEEKKERKPSMISSKERSAVKAEKAKIRADKETLSDKYIANVIREKKAFLNRCYAQHLRLNPDARGRIDASLTIEPDGSISSARVVGSTIADPALQQCVISTLQRCRFKAFNGDPIILKYPINFE